MLELLSDAKKNLSPKRKGLMTGVEREKLIRKAMFASEIEQTEAQATLESYRRGLQQREEEQELKEYNRLMHPKTFTPLAGSISGALWNEYVKDLWTRTQGATIHTVRFPEGKCSQDIFFRKVEVKNVRTYKLEPGELPDTTCKPSEHFEAYVERDAHSPLLKLPSHFLVINAQAPPNCTEAVLRAEEEQRDRRDRELKQRANVNRGIVC